MTDFHEAVQNHLAKMEEAREAEAERERSRAAEITAIATMVDSRFRSLAEYVASQRAPEPILVPQHRESRWHSMPSAQERHDGWSFPDETYALLPDGRLLDKWTGKTETVRDTLLAKWLPYGYQVSLFGHDYNIGGSDLRLRVSYDLGHEMGSCLVELDDVMVQLAARFVSGQR